jgi:hypothetical protein
MCRGPRQPFGRLLYLESSKISRLPNCTMGVLFEQFCLLSTVCHFFTTQDALFLAALSNQPYLESR